MKNILIQGGTDGMGRELANHYLSQGNNVIIVGHSKEKGSNFINFAKGLNAGDRASFIQADLSLVSENNRVISEIKKNVDKLDSVFFFAANQKFRPNTIITREGFEHTFALYYLSRFVLSYGLSDLLKKSDSPLIFNISAPGMKGELNFDNLQFTESFESFKAMQNGSRLNDLMSVKYSKENPEIRTVLYNPWLVTTNGLSVSQKSFVMKIMMKFMSKFIGRTPKEAATQIIELISSSSNKGFYAFIKEKPVDISMPTFDLNKSELLYKETKKLLK